MFSQSILVEVRPVPCCLQSVVVKMALDDGIGQSIQHILVHQLDYRKIWVALELTELDGGTV